MEHILEKMVKLREMEGIKRLDLSRLMGQHEQYVTRLEGNYKTIRLSDLLNYSKHFKVSVNWLIGLED